jgi:hypothetical protein
LETSVTLWLTVSDSLILPVVAKGEGRNFAVLAYIIQSHSGEFFFPNNHQRIVLKECVSGNQSYMRVVVGIGYL